MEPPRSCKVDSTRLTHLREEFNRQQKSLVLSPSTVPRPQSKSAILLPYRPYVDGSSTKVTAFSSWEGISSERWHAIPDSATESYLILLNTHTHTLHQSRSLISCTSSRLEHRLEHKLRTFAEISIAVTVPDQRFKAQKQARYYCTSYTSPFFGFVTAHPSSPT